MRYPTLILLLAVFLSGCETVATRSEMDDHTGTMGQRADQKKTGKGDIYVQLAAGYMRQGNMAVALKQAKRAIELDPGSVDANNILALIYERLGDYDLAELYYRQGIALDPENSYILNAYGTYLCTQRRYQESDARFKMALKNPLYPTPEVVLTNAGICARRKGDLQQAETYLRRALTANPRFGSALIEMTRLSLQAGRYLSVRAYLQRYLEVARPTAESLWIGIQAENQLGDHDAVASYTLLLRNEFPDSPELQLLRESGIK